MHLSVCGSTILFGMTGEAITVSQSIGLELPPPTCLTLFQCSKMVWGNSTSDNSDERVWFIEFPVVHAQKCTLAKRVERWNIA